MRALATACLAVVPLLATPASARAALPALTLAHDRPVDVTDTLLEVLPDPSGRMKLDEAAAAGGWAVAPRLSRGLPVRVYWGRLRLVPQLSQPETWVLVPNRYWQHLDLYLSLPSGAPEVVRSGTAVPLGVRPLPYAEPLLPVTLAPSREQTMYLRFESDFNAYVWPDSFLVRVAPQALLLEQDLLPRHFQGLYGGLMLAVVIYNLFLFFSVRDRIYLLYVLYAGAFGSIWMMRAGLGLEVLWPNWTAWDSITTFVFSGLAIVFGNRFAQVFLELRRHAPLVNRALTMLSAAVIAVMAVGLSGRWGWAEDPLALAAIATCVLFVAGGVTALRRGYRPARIFLVATSTLILGVVAYVLTFFGLLPAVVFTVYGVQIGSALEMVLLAFALGSRIRILEREKREADAHYRANLEIEVAERTSSLAEEKRRVEAARREAEAANRKLVDVNRQLEEISHTDAGTGLANRRRFDAVLDTEWRRTARTAEPLSLIVVDVDHFKAYNDYYGHIAGDECLRRVAETLADGCRRAGDLVARVGGEEFAVVLGSMTLEESARLAESLRAAVSALAIPHVLSPFQQVTLSAGVASTEHAFGNDSANLYADADTALYTAKRAGRNRVAVAPLVVEPASRRTAS